MDDEATTRREFGARGSAASRSSSHGWLLGARAARVNYQPRHGRLAVAWAGAQAGPIVNRAAKRVPPLPFDDMF